MAQNACTKFTDNYELKEELGKAKEIPILTQSAAKSAITSYLSKSVTQLSTTC